MVVIDNVTYTLTDLNPNDGITPSVDLTNLQTFEDTYIDGENPAGPTSVTKAGGSMNWLVSPNTAIQFNMQVTSDGGANFATAGIGAEGTDEWNSVSQRGSFSDTLSTTFANNSNQAAFTGYGYNLSWGAEGGPVSLPVPEPATWATLAVGLVCVALLTRLRGAMER